MTTSTIVATAGSATANSYVTLAVANQYHEDRPPAGTTWSGAASDAVKDAALLWATTLMDNLFEWTGWPAVPTTQALLWPRSGMRYRNGVAVPITIIPVELQEATAEYARQLLAEDRAADSDIETQGINKIVAGPVELGFKNTVSAKVVPDAAVHLLVSEWYSAIRGRASMTAELQRA